MDRRFRSYPGKAWINDYLDDLIKELLEHTGLDNDDERLVMSIRRSLKLPVTINQRYVIRCSPPGKIGLIMPLSYDPSANQKKDCIVGNDYFYKSTIKEARWVEFDRANGVNLSPEIIQLWKEAAARELTSGTRSSFRKFHRPIFHKAVQDLEFRKLLIGSAFRKL